MGKGKPYVNDFLYRELNRYSEFREMALRVIPEDWRNGTSVFQEAAQVRIDQILSRGIPEGWGEISIPYLEGRFMEWVTPEETPWLWAYKQLTGALLDPETVRSALNNISR